MRDDDCCFMKRDTRGLVLLAKATGFAEALKMIHFLI